MKIPALVFIALSGAAFAACLPVTGDRITGHDLALADAQFAALPAAMTVAFAPAPGAQRVFAVAELSRIARANGLAPIHPGEICFAIPMRRAGEAEVVAAMRRSLPPQAEIAIVELPKTDLPAGDIEFPAAALEPSIGDAQVWRGYVRYSSTKKAPLWARVRISERVEAVVAAKDLAANVPIAAASLRIETRNGPVERRQVALRIEDVVGRIPKQAIRSGTPIPLDLLATAPSIRRGDAVKVEVRSGRAHLSFDAVAENEAREGDMVALRNPVSGKIFRARVEGSKAVIVIGEREKL